MYCIRGGIKNVYVLGNVFREFSEKQEKINEPLAKANGKQGCHTRCIYNIKEILIFIQMERSRLLTWRCINSYPVSSKLMTG